jgi:hypothetical protein
MKVFVAILSLFTTLAFSHHSQSSSIQLEGKTFLAGKVSLQLPADFEPMGEEMLKFKYPAERRPTLVYSNKAASVSVALNHTNNRVTPAQLPELHEAMEGMFKRLYPSATWFRSELIVVNGRQWFLLDLRTPAIDTEVRNLMLGTSLNDRLLIVAFNATRELEGTWLATGNRIIQSVRVRE